MSFLGAIWSLRVFWFPWSHSCSQISKESLSYYKMFKYFLIILKKILMSQSLFYLFLKKWIKHKNKLLKKTRYFSCSVDSCKTVTEIYYHKSVYIMQRLIHVAVKEGVPCNYSNRQIFSDRYMYFHELYLERSGFPGV